MMNDYFVTITADNIAGEHLSCIIRSRVKHEGVECKRQWLAERLSEDHVFRKLPVKEAVFIEYAPLEKAWVPVTGSNFFYIYCLWASGAYKGKGYGRALLETCIADAKAQGKSGICMLGSKRQKHWLSDQAFFKKHGFAAADSTADGYELLALSFDGTAPRFTDKAKQQSISNKELTIYYSPQCPYITQSLDTVKAYCAEQAIPLTLIHVDTLQKAKDLPCVCNNYGVFYNGKFETVNLLLDTETIRKIVEKK